MTNLIRYFICIGMCLSLSFFLFPIQAQNKDIITLNGQNQTVQEVVASISEQSGQNILVDPDILIRVSITIENIPWFEALELLAEQAKCKVVRFSENIWRVTQPPLVSFEFQDADLLKIISVIATVTQTNIVCSRDIQGKVNVRLKDVSWEQALQELLSAVNPEYKIFYYRPNFLYIVQEPHFLRLTSLKNKKAITPSHTKRIDFHAQGEPLSKAITALNDITGAKILVDPKISAKITGSLKNVPWFEVLQFIAFQAQCELIPVGDQLWKITKPATIDLASKEENLSNMLMLLAEMADFSLVSSSEILQEKVSLQLENISWFEALETLALISKYELVNSSPGIFRLTKMSE